ncbi:glycoside hydrolase family 31 protein [Alkalibacterium sp. MB6]|uniref:glycoside hydrolase family 31 protein n=1 Tax=Alkalibacterium sp. MB6 TaxID=2081965 RepID=UPI001379F655|nr:glycoside hydrolase family 31 protein [Alkalibacterium sp. MB6]
MKQNGNCIQGDRYRFIVIKESILRMEYSETGHFEDRPTRVIKNRDLGETAFEIKETADTVEIITDTFHMLYTKEEPFSPKTLHIDVRYNFSNYTNRWYFGQHIDTLKGSLRTLDRVNGEAPLEESIISRFGYATLNDSKSFVFDEEDNIIVKEDTHTDVYFFAHGRNYREAIKDFYRLSGFPPKLPRFALGNWWSRYWAYTEESYLTLMDRFKQENLPLAVSVIDMDWHLTNIPSTYGSGWTGYTWNRDLFPDPKSFLKQLEERGLAITLNVHPADGIRGFEEQYERVAERLNLNQNIEEPAQFDLMNTAFREAYFEEVHHPLEEMGVDFWWIDWQQGEFSRSDIDSLWLLNHYHFKDNEKRHTDGLILSRYAGPGSHRYPIGFSGDAMTTWESLAFQPYLTATSSNIGYTWWSHDIGGHYKGSKDEELVLRWFQFGVFSPINRLHSTKNSFSSKEPWLYSDSIRKNMGDFLRLRHALIPYLYTANILTHEEGIPLVQPIYYEHPFEEKAYEIRNEYYFGNELLVLPITRKKDNETLYGSELIYLPEGNWFDVFTNFRYKGGSVLQIFREETAMPVFAKEGSIIPLDAQPTKTKATELPEVLEWHLYPGASHSYDLIEDRGEDRVTTTLTIDRDNKKVSIKLDGDKSVLPENRSHIIHFDASTLVKLTDTNNVTIVDEVFDPSLNRTSITLQPKQSVETISLEFDNFDIIEKQDITQEVFKRLDKAQVEYELKEDIFATFIRSKSELSLMAMINELNVEQLSRSLFELLYIKHS